MGGPQWETINKLGIPTAWDYLAISIYYNHENGDKSRNTHILQKYKDVFVVMIRKMCEITTWIKPVQDRVT